MPLITNNSFLGSNDNVQYAPNRCPKWIVIHYTGCRGMAREVARAMIRGKVSTHYICDEFEILHAVSEDSFTAWHCSTIHRKTYSAAKNHNSIGVDLCTKKGDWRSRCVADCDWYFEHETMENAARVVADCMERFAIPLSQVVRHWDVTRKECPRPFVGDDINTHSGKTGIEAWAEFLEMVKEKQCEKMDM